MDELQILTIKFMKWFNSIKNVKEWGFSIKLFPLICRAKHKYAYFLTAEL